VTRQDALIQFFIFYFCLAQEMSEAEKKEYEALLAEARRIKVFFQLFYLFIFKGRVLGPLGGGSQDKGFFSIFLFIYF
jgi:hypothetical protein